MRFQVGRIQREPERVLFLRLPAPVDGRQLMYGEPSPPTSLGERTSEVAPNEYAHALMSLPEHISEALGSVSAASS